MVYANLLKGSGTTIETVALLSEVEAVNQCCANQVCTAYTEIGILARQVCVTYNYVMVICFSYYVYVRLLSVNFQYIRFLQINGLNILDDYSKFSFRFMTFWREGSMWRFKDDVLRTTSVYERSLHARPYYSCSLYAWCTLANITY